MSSIYKAIMFKLFLDAVKLICYTQSIQRKTIGDVEYGN